MLNFDFISKVFILTVLVVSLFHAPNYLVGLLLVVLCLLGVKFTSK